MVDGPMKFRKHQKEMAQIIDRIIDGDPTNDIFVTATPGSGKSLLPVLAGKLIRAGKADSIAWIVPRLSLAYQGETVFLDPFFRRELKHDLTIRSATNDDNPARGTNGFTSTYQAVSVDDRQTILKDFQKRRYILVLDEYHHAERDGLWHQKLDEIVKKAAYTIKMTGTLHRNNDQPIAWTPYDNRGWPDFKDKCLIKYTRMDALKERAIIPLTFKLSDGFVEWEDQKGKSHKKHLSKEYEKAGDALYTALNTEFADELLMEGLNHWTTYKQTHPRSKLLVVTANYDHAKRFMGLLPKNLKQISDIATSHDSPSAQKAIKTFKYGKIDILITIQMAYEGLDVPQISHIISLTHIRSVPWIIQMVARAVRIDPQAGPYETQMGFIFAPDDTLFRRVVHQIQSEQVQAVKEREKLEFIQGEKSDQDGEKRGQRPDVIPLGSRLTDQREVYFGNSFAAPSFSEPEIQTISDIEDQLRTDINDHVREFAFKNYYKPAKINAEIKNHFGLARELMTEPQLRTCLYYVRSAYPVAGAPSINNEASQPRGKGRRVPVQAVLWGGNYGNV
jgi:superfamily II DNA or RNA helicase